MKQIYNKVVLVSLIYLGNLAHTRGMLRIINGEIAPENTYPWFYDAGSCGASLIAPDMLLTAAHCSEAFEDKESYTRFLHPQYLERDDSVLYDFMVVKLKHPILDVTPVPLDDGQFSSKYEVGKDLWTLGMLLCQY